MSQDYPDVEIIVIDDGSTDDTPEIAAEFGGGIRYIRQRNKGLPETRNTGLREARTEWVIFMDADDRLSAEAVSLSVKFLQKSGVATNFVVFGEQIFSDDSYVPVPVDDGVLQCPLRIISLRDVVLRNRFGVCGLARRAAMLELGGFNRLAGGSDDRDMLIKLAQNGPIYFLDAPLRHYRVHSSSMCHNTLKQSTDTDWVLKNAREKFGSLLPASDWAMARAIYFYQVAYSYILSGNLKNATVACLRSIATTPWISSSDSSVLPFLARTRLLLRLAIKLSCFRKN
jgi:glycosyltransferase involved in cell wall biosynthesis